MTPKDKAKELVDKMHSQMPIKVIPIASTRENQLSCDIDLKGSLKNAKQCALIAVDELLKEEFFWLQEVGAKKSESEWQQVKQEINKL